MKPRIVQFLVIVMVLPVISRLAFANPRKNGITYRFSGPNTDCVCVPPEHCDDLNGDAEDFGNGIIEPRITMCPNFDHVCCEHYHPEDSSPEEEEYPYVEGGGVVDEPRLDCGMAAHTTGKLESRITKNSNATKFGELPWNLIVIEDVENGKNLYKCGGSLIHPQVVVTAAHCVFDLKRTPAKIIVRAGGWDIKNRNKKMELAALQHKTAKEILIYPGYSAVNLRNDVALLFLSEPFALTDTVRTICLPNGEMRQLISDNNCIASGWGKDSMTGSYSMVLKKVHLPIVSQNRCVSSLRKTKLGKSFRLHHSFICAGGQKDVDTCKGDGGSPLICPLEDHSGRYAQVGIVSWGIGCGRAGVPGVYVNLPLYVNWIDNVLNRKGFDVNFYKIT